MAAKNCIFGFQEIPDDQYPEKLPPESGRGRHQRIWEETWLRGPGVNVINLFYVFITDDEAQ